jgi:hypothetical protein
MSLGFVEEYWFLVREFFPKWGGGAVSFFAGDKAGALVILHPLQRVKLSRVAGV